MGTESTRLTPSQAESSATASAVRAARVGAAAWASVHSLRIRGTIVSAVRTRVSHAAADHASNVNAELAERMRRESSALGVSGSCFIEGG
jgi:hypothetical protein